MADFDPMNPQAPLMADESMVRTLKHQADAIWPQERPLLERYAIGTAPRILDVGCGTGEITLRLAELFPTATVVGVDLIESHLELGRKRAGRLAERVRFETGNAYGLELADGAFDLTVCRHVLQAIPQAERVLAELLRVTRPGGRLHLLVEDYGMIFFHPARLDVARFWLEGPRRFGAATGTDLHVGRATFTHLRRLGVQVMTIDYVVVDTLRVPRETFAQIWIAWRDGYAEAIARHTGYTVTETVAHFDDMIATMRDPDGYAVWMVPIVSALVPVPGS